MSERGVFLCRSCGHRAPVDLDEGADALLEPGDRQGPALALGLVPCPACGKRDARAVLMAALVPTLAGALGGAVLAGLALGVGLAAMAGPDPRANDAMVPSILAVAIAVGLAGGAGVVAMLLRSAFRRAASKVTFGADPGGDALATPLGAPSLGIDVERRGKIALGLTTISALFVVLFHLGGSLPVMIAIGAVSGGIAGAIRGVTSRERLVFGASFMVAEIGVIVATALYVQGRTSVWNVELLLPLLVGAIPGALVYLGATRLLARPAAAS